MIRYIDSHLLNDDTYLRLIVANLQFMSFKQSSCVVERYIHDSH